MDTPKILSVQALENRNLLVKFVNGVEKIYDCNPLLSYELWTNGAEVAMTENK